VPAAVLFDLYDTLVSSDWASWRTLVAGLMGVSERVADDAFAATRRARNRGDLPNEEAEMRAVIEATGVEDPPIEVVRSLATVQFEFQRDRVALEPEVREVVGALRDRGVRTAIVSNCSRSTSITVERLGLDELVDAIVLSFEVHTMKPEPQIYEFALERLGGIAPEDALFVDDQVAFCDGARRLGIDTRLLLRPHADPAEGVSPHTNGHPVIDDLRPLLAT
jgi:putative hydrolase of the HAD superfamily